MADPSPAEPTEAQEAEPVEGQEPAVAADDPPEAKTYPESYVRQLRAESGNYRKKMAELEEKLQDIEDADKSENEKLMKRLALAEQRATSAETGLLRFEVAAERGLDSRAASFLTGSTREEMELRAEELAGLLAEKQGAPGSRSVSFDGGARVPAPTQGPPEEEHNDFLMQALGRGGRAPNR